MTKNDDVVGEIKAALDAGEGLIMLRLDDAPGVDPDVFYRGIEIRPCKNGNDDVCFERHGIPTERYVGTVEAAVAFGRGGASGVRADGALVNLDFISDMWVVTTVGADESDMMPFQAFYDAYHAFEDELLWQ